MRGWLRATIAALLAVAILAALALVMVVANPATLKPLGNYLSQHFLQRPLHIDGELTLELSLQPRLTARQVRFGNAPWSGSPYMAQAGYLMVQLDLGALLDRRVHLLDLDIRQAEVLLEDRVDGAPNWSFFEDDEPEEEEDWSFMVEGLTVTDSSIRAVIGELAPMLLSIPELSESTDGAGNLTLTGHGTLNDAPWRLQGSIGTFRELMAAGRIELDLDLMVDDTEMAASGTIGELRSLTGMDLSLRLKGPDADVLGEIFEMTGTFANDIHLTARIRPEGSVHHLSVTGHVSDFQVEASGTVANLAAFDGWDGRIDLRGPDAGVFGKALQIPGFPDGPFRIAGGVHRHGGDLDLADVVLVTDDVQLSLNADFVDFPRREGALASIRAVGDDFGQFRRLLGIPTLPENAPFEFRLSLDASSDATLTTSLTVGSHELTASGRVGEYPDYRGTRLQVALSGEDAAELLALAGVSDALTGPYRAGFVFRVDESGLSATRLDIRNGPFTLTGTASLPDPRTPNRFSVDGSLQVSSLQAAGRIFRVENLPDEPLRLQAALSSGRRGLVIDDAAARFRGTRASLRGTLGALPALGEVDLHLSVEGSDLYHLTEIALPARGRALPFTLDGRLAGKAESVLELVGLRLKTNGGELTLSGPVALSGDLAGTRLRISGRGPDFSGLMPALPHYTPPDRPWKISGTVEFPAAHALALDSGRLIVGSVQFRAHGLLHLEDQWKTDLNLEATGESLADLGRFGVAELPHMPFRVSTSLEGGQDAISVSHLEAAWGDSDLTASGSISLSGKPAVVLTGRSANMNLIDLQKAIFGEPEDMDPSDDLQRVFPDTPIPVQDLALLDADIDIQVGRFHGVHAKLRDVELAFRLEEGVLALERAAYRDDTGFFNATAVLRPEGESAHMELQLTGQDAMMGLFTTPDQPRDTRPRYSLDVAVTGTGATVAEMMGNLDGRILVSSDGGRISNALLSAYMGDFVSNVLDLMNPFVKSEPFTAMQCMVINASIEDGTLRLEPGLVMRTNRLNMFVFGTVDLASERLNLALASQARRGIGISAASITNPYFKIGGTLASPALQLDPASAAVAAGIATATAGLSIVVRGIWDRMMGQRNPCPQFLNYQRPEKQPPESRP